MPKSGINIVNYTKGTVIAAAPGILHGIGSNPVPTYRASLISHISVFERTFKKLTLIKKNPEFFSLIYKPILLL
jgi:hypothetical protein